MKFDKYGNPFPYGIIEMEGEDFRSEFVSAFHSSGTREKIYSGYSKYNLDMKSSLNGTDPSWFQFANGSFTTNKITPNDIDVVNFIDYNLIDFEKIKSFQTVYGSKQKYEVDGYIVPVYPENEIYYDLITRKRYDYWMKWFGQDREGHPKAIIKLRID